MRERDIRSAVKTLLDSAGLFDVVWHGGLQDPKGIAASDLTGCGIEPASTAEDLRIGHGGGFQVGNTGLDDSTDGAILYMCKINLDIVARNEDSQIRDELAERLLNTARNALNGQSLGGLTFPQFTKVTGWSWKPASSAERLIMAVLECHYEEEGWQAADVTE